MRVQGTISVVAGLLTIAASAGLRAQSPFDVAKDGVLPGRVALGASLFFSKDLSEDQTTSCATCHDPAKSFADGRSDAVGRLGIATGRNSPTLFALALIPEFRDPNQAATATPGRAPRTLDLVERCLAPLGNGLEMGTSAAETVKRLRSQRELGTQFDAAFEGRGGVTKRRLGEALAAYVTSLTVPAAPYRAYLAGDQRSLGEAALRGLEIFRGVGRCDECHSGWALTDGRLHVADPPDGQRRKDRERTAAERRMKIFQAVSAEGELKDLTRLSPEELDREILRRASRLPGGGGYDPGFVEVQTPTLWDVARTAPYFRDGTVATLPSAVRIHSVELREVAARRDVVDAAVTKAAARGLGTPPRLRAARPPGGRPAPGELSDREFLDLLAFLEALSVPR